MIEKARQDLETKTSDHQTNQSGRSKPKHTRVTVKYIPRGESDVIRLRNPTEDKRAFRRMLTSADLFFPTNKIFEGICLALVEEFLQKEL